MKTEWQYFSEALPMKDYVNNMTQLGLKEQTKEIYEKFRVSVDGFIEKLKAEHIKILAITEDWCGDAMLNNPILWRIAEEANAEIRCVYRDEDTDLIDRYLTNGGRAIPIYLFFNQAGDVVAKWGPRTPEIQQLVENGRTGLPDKEHPRFKEAQSELYTNLCNRYATDSQCWAWVYEDVKRTLGNALWK